MVSAAAEPVASDRSRRTTFLLHVVTAFALVLRVAVSKYHPLDHNGGWHLFAARNFAREYTKLAHPPLFLLLLKGCDAISHTLAAYRFFPILAGVGSVFLTGRILEKLGTLPAVAVLGALTMACAQTGIALSLEVEAYTLCVFLLLASFYCYLDIVSPDRPPPRRSRVAFSALSTLALLAHYFAGLFLVACVLAPVAAAATRPSFGRAFFRVHRRRWKVDLLTILPPTIAGGVLYFWLARRWVVPLNNMSSFYFRPGEEMLSSFLIRNLRDTFNLFAPLAFPRARQALPILGGFLAIVIWAPATEKRTPSKSQERLFPSLFLTTLLGVGMLLGVLGRYPFGGLMRQQFLIFVFALLAGFVALERFLRALPSNRRTLVLALCVLALGLDFALNREEMLTPAYRHEALVGRRGIFRESLSRTRAVHVDLFNLIGMVMDFYDWEWKFAGRNPTNPSLERYELTRDGRALTVIAHRYVWIMDFASPGLYSELRASFRMSPAPCQTAFCVYRNLYAPPWTKLPDRRRRTLEAQIPALAAAAGFDLRALELTDHAVCAELCATPSR